jgi:hypothetical protein
MADTKPVRAYQETFVAPYAHQDLTHQEQQILSTAVNAAGDMMAHRQMNALAKSEDTAITHAVGGIIAAVPYVLITAGITGALLLLGLWVFGGEEVVYLFLWIFSWGVVSLYFVHRNRETSLDHSPAGIARMEIESREEVAKYTVDRFVTMLERKWNIRA